MYASAFGPIRAVRVPHAIHGTFIDWFRRCRPLLVGYMDEDVPRWQGAPKTWEVPPPAAVRTETVVGARLAKQEKTQRVVHSGKLDDVELGYYDSQLSAAVRSAPPVRAEDGDPNGYQAA